MLKQLLDMDQEEPSTLLFSNWPWGTPEPARAIPFLSKSAMRWNSKIRWKSFLLQYVGVLFGVLRRRGAECQWLIWKAILGNIGKRRGKWDGEEKEAKNESSSHFQSEHLELGPPGEPWEAVYNMPQSSPKGQGGWDGEPTNPVHRWFEAAISG